MDLCPEAEVHLCRYISNATDAINYVSPTSTEFQEQMTKRSPSLLCSTWLFLATADCNKSISVPARKCERSFYRFNFNYSFALQLDFPELTMTESVINQSQGSFH